MNFIKKDYLYADIYYQTMGYIRLPVKVSNPDDRSKYVDINLLVDTGAVFTLVSKQTLQGIGIKPVEEMEFVSISNQKLKREVGTAYIEVEGKRWLTSIIFGEEGDVEVLGVTTLEQLGLQVDPVSGTVKPLPLYLL